MKTHPKITSGTIDPTELIESVKEDSAGGIVVFLGTVRNMNEGNEVEVLEYEVYREMAQKKMEEIESEVRKRWNVKGIRMTHRQGTLRVGEISVAVAVSSEHRGEAFEACRFAIDRIKRTLPIWKTERTKEGKELPVRGRPIAR